MRSVKKFSVEPNRRIPEYETHFLAGIEHFNARRFWEAHESWETIWLESEGDEKQFLQGLIQIAAAYHHIKRGTLLGVVRLFDAASRRLALIDVTVTKIDVPNLLESVRQHREWAGEILSRSRGQRRVFHERLSDPEFPGI